MVIGQFCRFLLMERKSVIKPMLLLACSISLDEIVKYKQYLPQQSTTSGAYIYG